MKIMGEDISFENGKHRLITKRLGEDYSKYGRILYLEKNSTHPNLSALVAEYKEVNQKNKYEKDLYVKSKNEEKLEYIISELLKPILEERKRYYENNYDVALTEKRNIEKEKIIKYLKSKNMYDKNKEIILPF